MGTPLLVDAMLTKRLEWFLFCCRRETHHGQPELQVLSSDTGQRPEQIRALSQADSFDITFTPRAGLGATVVEATRPPITPRQKELRDQLQLPELPQYPVAPGVTATDSEETRRQMLLEMYQEFALELHAGTFLKQLTSTRQYANIHCQLMEDLQTLKLDQSSGRIVEFPLSGVSKVYRIVRDDDKWRYTTPSTGASLPVEHIVVVEFMRRKLAFVFDEVSVAIRFLTCMELLTRRAQQQQQQQQNQQADLKAAPKAVATPASPMVTVEPSRHAESRTRQSLEVLSGCGAQLLNGCQHNTAKKPIYVCM
jgi:hypothetical protein